MIGILLRNCRRKCIMTLFSMRWLEGRTKLKELIVYVARKAVEAREKKRQLALVDILHYSISIFRLDWV